MIKTKMSLFPEIEKVVNTLHPDKIPADRKAVLQPLADFVKAKVAKGEAIRINFICTHNSRRSHLSQVWAQTLASHFKVGGVSCYSGGTEATVLFPMVAETLKKQGFQIRSLSGGDNPVYAIKYAENEAPVIGFSKKLDDDFNPKSGFAAIMTCDAANEACPFVPGAEQRIPITFEDPKVFDHTTQQAEKYEERSLQIATELWYVFSQINS